MNEDDFISKARLFKPRLPPNEQKAVDDYFIDLVVEEDRLHKLRIKEEMENERSLMRWVVVASIFCVLVFICVLAKAEIREYRYSDVYVQTTPTEYPFAHKDFNQMDTIGAIFKNQQGISSSYREKPMRPVAVDRSVLMSGQPNRDPEVLVSKPNKRIEVPQLAKRHDAVVKQDEPEIIIETWFCKDDDYECFNSKGGE
jgi:hypothetical protein